MQRFIGCFEGFVHRAVAASLALLVGGVAHAETNTLLARAPIDECFCGIGDPDNITRYEPGFEEALTPSEDCSGVLDTGEGPSGLDTRIDCIPKRNGDRAWGLAVSGPKGSQTAWWGTAHNTPCWGLQGQLSTIPLVANFVPPSDFSLNGQPFSACEQSFSGFPRDEAVPPAFGDHRPPEIWYLPLGASPPATAGVAQRLEISESCGPGGQALLDRTVGLRSAGATDDYVIMAGPDISGTRINMFLMRNSPASCVQYKQFSQYLDIRKWLRVGNTLYTTVGNTGGKGAVLRWRGVSAFSPDDLRFEVVGDIEGAGANLALHEGRIFVHTWPNVGALDIPPSLVEDPTNISLTDLRSLLLNIKNDVGVEQLWMSPKLWFGGLRRWDRSNWKLVWSIKDYDPNPATQRTLGGGGIASNGDELCWGTMQFPLVAQLAHIIFLEPDLLVCLTGEENCFAAEDPRGQRFSDVFANNERNATVFCGNRFGTAFQKVDLLYGEAELPVFEPPLFGGEGWAMKPNGLNQEPRLGGPGIVPDSVNIYTWTATACEADGEPGKEIYLGTADISQEPDGPNGGDLLALVSTSQPVREVDTAGVGNRVNAGPRTAACFDGTQLLLGLANIANLADSEPPPVGAGMGGWEIRLLSDLGD